MANKRFATSWQLQTTPAQEAAIRDLLRELHIRRDIPTTRWDARRLLHELEQMRKDK